MKNKPPILSFLARHFKSFVRARSGSALLEFAIVAPLFFLIVCGIIEFGIIMYTYAIVEGATSMVARIGKTGYTTGGDRASEIKNAFYQRTGGFLDITRLHICSNPYAQYSDITTVAPCTQDNNPPPPEPGSPPPANPINPGNAGQVVLYTVTYEWKVITPLLWPFFLNGEGPEDDGKAYISAVATVKNEQF